MPLAYPDIADMESDGWIEPYQGVLTEYSRKHLAPARARTASA